MQTITVITTHLSTQTFQEVIGQKCQRDADGWLEEFVYRRRLPLLLLGLFLLRHALYRRPSLEKYGFWYGRVGQMMFVFISRSTSIVGKSISCEGER